jgi:hypothetical protein
MLCTRILGGEPKSKIFSIMNVASGGTPISAAIRPFRATISASKRSYIVLASVSLIQLMILFNNTSATTKQDKKPSLTAPMALLLRGRSDVVDDWPGGRATTTIDRGNKVSKNPVDHGVAWDVADRLALDIRRTLRVFRLRDHHQAWYGTLGFVTTRWFETETAGVTGGFVFEADPIDLDVLPGGIGNSPWMAESQHSRARRRLKNSTRFVRPCVYNRLPHSQATLRQWCCLNMFHDLILVQRTCERTSCKTSETYVVSSRGGIVRC